MPVQAPDQIDEAVRKRFESDWKSGHPQPIGSYLKEGPPTGRLATLEELIQIDMEFRWRQFSSGPLDETVLTAEDSTVRPVASPPLVETYLDQFPDLSDSPVLQRLLEAEIALRRASGLPVDRADYQRRFPNQPLPANWFAARDAEVFPKPWGDYTLTARLGQGAMGVVYRAEQAAAHREVALKRILTEKFVDADPTRADEVLARFETEAKAAAQLTHENIVPVYDVGKVEGQPYFAMRLVEGDSLADLVRENTLAPERAATLMKEVAEGIQHAHRQGVLHRDIKPANILLESATGKALITDFGLAKWESTDQTLTQAGQLVGTPAYMPPEQARDPHQASERSDVYSIGATLYHLLTGRPPFQAAGMVELLRHLLHEEPLAPRKLNSDIPRDLETICLQCLHKEPARRYQSAGAVADDLQRYLEHRPVQARPISTVERAVRWCRRNKGIATASGFAILCVLIALCVGWGAYFVTQGKNARLAALNADLVESNQLGASQIDDYFVVASNDVLLNLPSMQPVRHNLLLMARDYHQEFARLRRYDPDAQADVAVSELRLGQIASLTGQPEDGLAQFDKALTMIAALPDEKAKQKRVRIAEGDAWNATGTARAHQKKFTEADAAFAKAEQTRQALVNDFPDETEIARKLFNIRMNRGIVALNTGDVAKAERLERQAQQERADWLKQDQYELLRRDYAMGQYNLAKITFRTSQDAQTRKLLIDALDRFRQLIETNPLDVELRTLNAHCRKLLGKLNVSADDFEAAVEHFRIVTADVEAIVRENPSVPDYQLEAARILTEIGHGFVDLRETHQAEASRLRVEELLASLPLNDPRVRYATAMNQYLGGMIGLSNQQYRSALDHYRESLELLAALALDHPEESLYELRRDEVINDVAALERVVETLEQSDGATQP